MINYDFTVICDSARKWLSVILLWKGEDFCQTQTNETTEVVKGTVYN